MRKTASGVATAFLIALVAGYAAVWGQYYVAALYPGEVRGLDITPLHSTCQLVGQNSTECLSAYSIPVSLFKGTQSVISFGIVLPEYRITCDRKGGSSVSRGHILENRNSPVTFDQNVFGCDETVDLTIWKANYYPIQGLLGGNAFLATPRAAQAYDGLVVFFYANLRIVLLVLFAFALAINAVCGRLELPGTRTSISERFLVPWAAFLLTSSGVLSTLLGGRIPSTHYVLLNSALSSMAHLGPILCSLLFYRFRSKSVFWIVMALCGIAPSVIPEWLFFYPRIGLITSVLALLMVFGRADGLTLGFAAIYAVNLLKLSGFVGEYAALLPHVHVSSVFLGVALFLRSLGKVRLIGDIMAAENAVEREPSGGNSARFLRVGLKAAHGLIAPHELKIYFHRPGASAVGVFSVRPSGHQDIKECTNIEIPAEVVRLLVIGSASAWKEALREHLRKSSERFVVRFALSQQGLFAAVVLIQLDSIPKDANALGDLFNRLEGYQRVLARVFGKYSMCLQNERAELKVQLHSVCKNSSDVDELWAYGSEFLENIHLRGFVGEVERASGKIRVLKSIGYTKEVGEFLGRLQFNAVDLGESKGPVPIAVTEQRIVVIDDIEVLKPHLTEYSQELLSWSEAKSLAVIPKNVTSANSKEGFVIYFESSEVARFGPEVVSLLTAFTDAFIEALVEMRSQVSAREANKILERAIPVRVIENIRKGRPVREERQGFLLCADIRGSTKLYRALGSADFTALISRISDKLVSCCAEFPSSELDVVTWDAFFISAENSLGPGQFLDLAVKCGQACDQILRDLGRRYQDLDLGVRVCITAGDVTRDLSLGINSSWTIVGGAMAEVCKFEAKVKSRGSGVFVDPLVGAQFQPFAKFVERAFAMQLADLDASWRIFRDRAA
jgi:class 3 adenylate cyclase